MVRLHAAAHLSRAGLCPDSEARRCRRPNLDLKRTRNMLRHACGYALAHTTPAPCRLTSATATSSTRGLHGIVADPVQGLLAELTLALPSVLSSAPAKSDEDLAVAGSGSGELEPS